MNIQERIELNKQKLTGIKQRISTMEDEKQELLQEGLRLDGELRILNEQLGDGKTPPSSIPDTKPTGENKKKLKGVK